MDKCERLVFVLCMFFAGFFITVLRNSFRFYQPLFDTIHVPALGVFMILMVAGFCATGVLLYGFIVLEARSKKFSG